MGNLKLSLVAGLLHIAAAVAARVVSTGSTVNVGDIHYFVPPWLVGRVGAPASTDDLVPVTIVNTKSESWNETWLSQTLESFLKNDDVIQEEFLKMVYLVANKSTSATPISSQYGTVVWSNFENNTVPDGPYFASSTGKLFNAYRLYTDFAGAFSETSITAPDGTHSVLPANVPGQSLAVAVPSQLHFSKSPNQPLAGVRLGVKDIYDVAGLKTSNGNRAWYNLYPLANTTAGAVQKLVDAGAIIIGKMKTSQFANGETATADWVDYHAPFNPRGDGYLDPSSSSAGPAAGAASYPWVDLAIGSDTGGSIRSPSQLQGIYGNRPSHGLVALDHTMPLSPEYDTAGLLTRNPLLWSDAATVLYQPNITDTAAYPKSILAVGFPTGTNAKLDGMLQTFLQNVTDLVSATSVRSFNLTDSWATTNPTAEPLLAMINSTYEVLSAKEQGRLVRDPFYADYAAEHDGRLPHVNPAPLRRWSLGDDSNATFEEAIANKTRFMDWFNGNVLKSDNVSCSSDLFVYVPRTPAPKYRDTYWTGPQAPGAFSTSRISVMAEVPDIVIPIGEIEYKSKVTNHTEYLPVTVDLMAAKGCDGMLFSLVRKMYEVGLIAEVKTGRSLVHGNDILY